MTTTAQQVGTSTVTPVGVANDDSQTPQKAFLTAAQQFQIQRFCYELAILFKSLQMQDRHPFYPRTIDVLENRDDLRGQSILSLAKDAIINGAKNHATISF